MTLISTDQPARLTLPAERGACPFAPPPAYERARREEPISTVRLWDGSPTWLVTRYDDVRAVLSDARFSADATKPGFPFLSETRRALVTTDTSFIRMDEPEHGRLRRMLTGDFMFKRIEALRPRVQEFADELIDRMTEGGRDRADLVAEFALPLPSLVICLVLGVPYEDHEFFQQCSRTLLNSNSTTGDVYDARARLRDYMVALADRKRGRPDESIISRLVERGELDADEVASMSLLLLVAGHETTANTLALLRNPGQMQQLRAHPELIRGAVEELLRYLTIVHSGLTRVATADVELAGHTIRAGEGAVCMTNTANRDEEAFPGGGDLDISRDARRHLAFGFGVHQCLGQPLARLELQIALSTLLRRLPGLRLDTDFERVSFRHEMLVYGVHALPVAW